MGTKAAISVEEYLHTSFPDLDKEYRDGEIVERSLPDELHSMVQAHLIGLFMAMRDRMPIFPRPELRLKLRPGLYLIPDVSVFHPSRPQQSVPDTPPLIAIEIVSSEDRFSTVREKLEEYHAWGVPHVWLVDPYSRRMYTCDGALNEVAVLTVPELRLEVGPADLFEETPAQG